MGGINDAYQRGMSGVYGQQQTDLAGQQAREAQQYAKDMPQQQEQQFGFQRGNALKGLATGMRDVNRAASKRGLLYSGLQQSGKADAANDAISNLQQSRAGINLDSENQLRSMEGGAMQTAQQDYQNRQADEDQRYQRELQKHKSQTGLLGNIFQGIGNIFGG